MLAEVTRNRAVRSFRLNGHAVGRHQHRGHQAQRAIALRHRVRLHVAVVVLARPDVAAGPFERRRHHVVDQAMLVGEAKSLELGREFGVEHFLEDVLEAPVIGLQNRVLGGQVHGVLAQDAVVQRGAGEIADRIVEVVHRHRNAGGRELEDFLLDHRAVVAFKLDRQAALAGHLEIGRAILIAVSMAANHDRQGPTRNKARHVLADDRLAENCAAKDVADRAIGRLPHLLEAEFLHARLVRRNGRALHGHAIFLGGFSRINRDLVVGLVAALDREIVIFQVNVEIGMDQLILDKLPDDAGHLVAVHFNDGIGDLDLAHAENPSARIREVCATGTWKPLSMRAARGKG